jgi:hypothetical protein
VRADGEALLAAGWRKERGSFSVRVEVPDGIEERLFFFGELFELP